MCYGNIRVNSPRASSLRCLADSVISVLEKGMCEIETCPSMNHQGSRCICKEESIPGGGADKCDKGEGATLPRLGSSMRNQKNEWLDCRIYPIPIPDDRAHIGMLGHYQEGTARQRQLSYMCNCMSRI